MDVVKIKSVNSLVWFPCLVKAGQYRWSQDTGNIDRMMETRNTY
jgi:hypothetical protein